MEVRTENEAKNLTENEQLELLKRIAENSEQQLKTEKERLKTARFQLIGIGVLVLFVLLAFFMVVPKLRSVLDDASESIEELSEFAENMGSFSEEFAEVDLKGMSDSITELVNQGKTTLNEAMTDVKEALENMKGVIAKVDEFDIDSLNSSIDAFSDVIEPLADFFSW